jgi:hypothetical protein
MTNMSPHQQLEACTKVFSNFKKASTYGIIRQYKVEDLMAVEGYSLRVEDPIDVTAIDSKLKGGLYNTPMEFVRDIRQMAANCLRFNVATMNNDVRRKGRELLRWVDERMSQELPGYVKRLKQETITCLDILDFLLDGAQLLVITFWNRIDVVLQGVGIWDEYTRVIDYPCDFSTLTTQLVLQELPAEVFLGRAEKVCLNAEHYWTQRNEEPGVVEAARNLRQKLAIKVRFKKNNIV